MIWLGILILCASLLYIFARKQTNYFKERGVPHIPQPNFIQKIVFSATNKRNWLELFLSIYNSFHGQRYYGTMFSGKPTLVIRDLELIKQVTIKDFDHFLDHEGFLTTDEVFTGNLFNMRGNQWKEMRATLSPAFTSSKMRGMYKFMNECARNLVEYFEKKDEDVIDVEMKEVFGKLANDVIASTSFGIQCNSMDEPRNEFYLMGKQTTDWNRFKQWKFFFIMMFPHVAQLLKLRVISKNVMNFFKSIIKETIEVREGNHVVRPDMIHLLLEARKGRLNHEGDKDSNVGFATVEESIVGRTNKKRDISDDEIGALAMGFFLGGFDTTSNAMSHMSMELCKSPDVQKKLIEEIDKVVERTHGDVTYEDIIKMKYLDQVITETLRMWPGGLEVDRICTKDYTIEPKLPHEKPYLVKKGEKITIPIGGIHYDPHYYKNPDTFDPERFNEENKHELIPGTYMPFGIGPRNCIGSRFALLEIKVVFFHLLSKFEISFTEKTKLPLKITVKGFSFRPEGGFQFGLKRRKIH